MKPVLSYTAGALLFRQLAGATRNGLPYRETLEILSQDPEMFGRDAFAVQALIRHLGEAGTLSGALARLPELVAPETALLVQAAEGHDAAPVLDAIADDFTELAQRGMAVRAALFWPAVVGVAVLLLVALMSIFVVPAFKVLYASFGADLPAATQFVVWLSDHAVWWLGLLLVAIVLFVARRRINVPPGLATAVQRVLLAVPFVRRYLVRSFSARTTNWLRAAHRNPDVLLAAVRHVRATTAMTSFALCLLTLETRLASGSLGQALFGLAPLPRRLPALVQLGERMGDVGGALAQAADFAEAERAAALAQFERWLVLALYLLLGVAVAVVAIAMYLPIFKMGEAVS